MKPPPDWLEAAKAAVEMMWDPDRPEEEDFARDAQWRAEWVATADEDRDIDDAHEFGQWVDDKFRKALADLRRAIAHEEGLRANARIRGEPLLQTIQARDEAETLRLGYRPEPEQEDEGEEGR